jgi:hypothetical protein
MLKSGKKYEVWQIVAIAITAMLLLATCAVFS